MKNLATLPLAFLLQQHHDKLTKKVGVAFFGQLMNKKCGASATFCDRQSFFN
jgi:hypothetical protein